MTELFKFICCSHCQTHIKGNVCNALNGITIRREPGGAGAGGDKLKEVNRLQKQGHVLPPIWDECGCILQPIQKQEGANP